MFKFAIFTAANKREVIEIIRKFKEFLISKNNLEDSLNPDIVFVFGGDGCLLDCISNYKDTDCSYMLINSGSLGFYREMGINEIERFYREFNYDKLKYETHHFVEIEDNTGKKFYGANEIMIASGIKTLDIDVKINDKYFMTSKGNGICISTPFGSSGYNHSLGGPLTVSSEGLILSLLAPIQNSRTHPAIHALVLRTCDVLKLKVNSNYNYEVASDMKNIKNLAKGEYVIKQSDKTFKLAHIKSVDKYQRIKRAFID